MKTIVIGAGYFGVNYVKELGGSCVGAVEPEFDRADYVATTYCIPVWPDIESVNVDYDGAIICTPPASHVPCALEVLKTGRYAMIEKPLATSVEEAIPLQQYEKKAMAGHIYLYHPGVIGLYRKLWDGKFQIDHAFSRRSNNGPVRNWQTAMWDLAAHDISIFNYLFMTTPTAVGAVGTYHWTMMTLEYPQTFANIYVSWLGGPKVRKVELVPAEGTGDDRIIFDDMNYPMEISPMRRMLDAFQSTDWGMRGSLNVGLDVVKVLEIAERSRG